MRDVTKRTCVTHDAGFSQLQVDVTINYMEVKRFPPPPVALLAHFQDRSLESLDTGHAKETTRGDLLFTN